MGISKKLWVHRNLPMPWEACDQGIGKLIYSLGR